MSTTHKPKPPDKGAPPEHKPSRKVALEEVMRTLQDLVSNELATEPEKPPGEAPSTAAKTKKAAPAEKQPAARSAFSADMLPAAPPIAAEPELIAPEGLPGNLAKPLHTPAEPPPTASSAVPPEGLQQELPYFEPIPVAPSELLPSPTPEAAQPDESSLLPESLPSDAATADIAADNSVPMDTAPASLTEAHAEPAEVMAPAEEIKWDDIPVLHEAVELTEDTDTGEAGHETNSGDMIAAMEFMPSAANLPPADAAHRLAIQVAARLNVELRKSGQGGLSSDIITRLARLLQEALAKGAPNMENTNAMDGGSAGSAGAVFRPPPDKH